VSERSRLPWNVFIFRRVRAGSDATRNGKSPRLQEPPVDHPEQHPLLPPLQRRRQGVDRRAAVGQKTD